MSSTYDISKLILDIQSDIHGVCLQKIAREVPDDVKDAPMMTQDELDMLSDGDFALCISTLDGKFLRRFPIVDKAHTWMSVKYFFQNKDKLPTEAKTIAATNLDRAMEYWGAHCAVPDGEDLCEYDNDNYKPGKRTFKETEDNTVGDLEGAANFEKESSDEIAAKLMAIGQGLDSAPANDASAQQKKARIAAILGAMKAGTPVPQEAIDAELGVPSEPKTAAIRGNIYFERPDDFAQVTMSLEKKASVALKGMEKTAFAISTPEGNFFNIETPALVKYAMSSFEDQYLEMDPKYRRELAVNVEKKAATMGIAPTENISKYASHTYNGAMLKLAMYRRLENIKDEYHTELFKAASQSLKDMNPEQIAEFLYQFDKQAGLNAYWGGEEIIDPYMSVFGAVKTAKVNADPFGVAMGMVKKANVGSYDISPEELHQLAAEPSKLKNYLDPAMIQAFVQSPEEFFLSLPKPNQEIIVQIIKGVLA